jgi:hypothetical protein
MSILTANNQATFGNALQQFMSLAEIQPGDAPSYQVCKAIYEYHPLGALIAGKPIEMAQSQKRDITIQKGPEDRLREQFEKEWVRIGADKHIANVHTLSRVYGIASVAVVDEKDKQGDAVEYDKLYKSDISFNVFDPLNTAGSLVLNQDPNAVDFQKTTDITVQGKTYHRSRSCIVMNEQPIYIGYTTSAFGYVGRSAYQRALFPLKSFLNSMLTDDMVTRKAGVLVAKMKPQGSIIDNIMSSMAATKRSVLKEAQTDNVVSISTEEDIESINLNNLAPPMTQARKNILENIAAAAGMPAKLLNAETFAEGFGEGTEDAKQVAQYIERERERTKALYDFFDKIVQYRAWNPDFYKTIQNDFPEEYGKVPYNQAFFAWVNSFEATWPSFLVEPPSEKVQVDDAKLRAVIALVEVLLPQCDPDNKAALLQWAADNFNELKTMFGSPLVLDYEALAAYTPEEPAEEPHAPRPFADSDAAKELGRAVANLVKRPARSKPVALPNFMNRRAANGAD